MLTCLRRAAQWRGNDIATRRGNDIAGRRGNVAVEFALIAPVLMIFIIGVFDVSKAMLLYQQVYNAAHTISISASNVAVQPDGSTSLTVAEVQQVLSAIYAEMPMVSARVETGRRSVTLSSITFVQDNPACVPTPTDTCNSTPYPAWSVGYTGGNATGFTVATRACGALEQESATGLRSGDLTSIPTAGITNPGPILVADVHYQYTPLFLNFVTGPIDFWATSFWPVRSTPASNPAAPAYTRYDVALETNGARKCQGFP